MIIEPAVAQVEICFCWTSTQENELMYCGLTGLMYKQWTQLAGRVHVCVLEGQLRG